MHGSSLLDLVGRSDEKRHLREAIAQVTQSNSAVDIAVHLSSSSKRSKKSLTDRAKHKNKQHAEAVVWLKLSPVSTFIQGSVQEISLEIIHSEDGPRYDGSPTGMGVSRTRSVPPEDRDDRFREIEITRTPSIPTQDESHEYAQSEPDRLGSRPRLRPISETGDDIGDASSRTWCCGRSLDSEGSSEPALVDGLGRWLGEGNDNEGVQLLERERSNPSRPGTGTPLKHGDRGTVHIHAVAAHIFELMRHFNTRTFKEAAQVLAESLSLLIKESQDAGSGMMADKIRSFQPSGEWECSYCMGMNDAEEDYCEVCWEHHDTEPSSPNQSIQL